MFRLGDTTLRGRGLQEARARASAGCYTSLLSHFPKTIYQKSHARFSSFCFSTTIIHRPLFIIRHPSFIETICQHLATNYATICNHTAPRHKLDGALHPLLPPSPLRSSYLPSLTTCKIISRESAIPRNSSPWGVQEGSL